MKKANPLGLRVLSTAAIMSIISSIAAPAFAGVYYINEGNVDVSVDADGNVKVTQNGQTYDDKNGEVIIRGGSAADYEDGRTDKGAAKAEETAIGESYAVTQEDTTGQQPVETAEEPQAEEPTEEPEAAEEPAQEPETPAEDTTESEQSAEQPEETADTPDAESEESAPDEQQPAAEEDTQESETAAGSEEAEDAQQPAESAQTLADESETADAEAATLSTQQDDSAAAPVAADPTPADTTPADTTPAARDTDMGDHFDASTGKLSGYYVAEGPKSETKTDADGNAEEIAGTGNTITIKNDWVNTAKNAFKFILENVNILNSNKDKAAMSVTGKGDTTIELDGNNVIKNTSYSSHAAVEKNGDETQTGTLTITDTDSILDADGNADDSKRGSLTVSGQQVTGIGGARGNNGENITIEGNAYVAASGSRVGIGGGDYDGASGDYDGHDGNNIRIDGNAYVVASGSNRGIGGSTQYTGNGRPARGGNGNNITISGTSTVYADGGIGGASYYPQGGDASITIEGDSTVYAGKRTNNAVTDGAYAYTAIGSGYGGDADITIGGNAKVKANVTKDGVGIGGQGTKTTVTIKDNAVIGDGSSSIGYKAEQKDAEITINIKDNATVGELKGFIGSSSGRQNYNKQVTVNILNNALVKKASMIGSEGSRATTVRIMDNANVTADGTGTVIGANDGTADITLGGDSSGEGKDTGTVTINATGGWGTDKPVNSGSHPTGFGIIGSNGSVTLNFAGKVKLSLNQTKQWLNTTTMGPTPFIHFGDSNEPTNEEMENLLKNTEGVDITYTMQDDTKTQIAHSTDLCEADMDNLTVTKKATCEEDGEAYGTCVYEKNRGVTGDTYCHNNVVKVVLPALGHDWGDWTVTREATCTEEGEETRVCSHDSAHVEHRAIAKKAHAWDEGVVTKAPTCTEEGERTFTCADCGATRTEPIAPDAANHTHLETEVGKKAPTCEEDGYTGDTVCADCGVTVATGSVLPATGHQHTEIINHKDPTCEEPGYTGDTKCDDCGKIIAAGSEIAATGHQHTETINRKDPTCEEPGYTGDTKCDDCGKIIAAGSEIAATGHQHTETINRKDPTCEEPGYTGDTRCDDCGKIIGTGSEIAAKGHTPTVAGAKDATETEDGYTGDTVCADCGKLLATGTVTPATGKTDNENTTAPELTVIVPGSNGHRLMFTVAQKGTTRTYTSRYDNATLTGTMETLEYLKAQGVETIEFVTNGRVSRFAVEDLLALCTEGDTFYLCHTADAEPTLLVIESDHTDLLADSSAEPNQPPSRF